MRARRGGRGTDLRGPAARAPRAWSGDRPRLGLAAAAGVFLLGSLALIPAIRDKVDNTERVVEKLGYEASLWEDLPEVIERAGGRDRLLRCGSVYTGPFQTQMMAYELGVHGLDVADARLGTPAPGVAFRTNTIPIAPLTAVDDPRFREVAANRRWQVETVPRSDARGRDCPAGGPGAPTRGTHPRNSRARVLTLTIFPPMASVASRARSLPGLDSLRTGVAGVVLFVVFLLLASLVLRTRALGASLWMDEGLSIGIASQPFFDIPGVLRQDGNPPLYYLLLSVWMDVVGNGPADTQGLSVAISLLAIPLGLWAGWTLFGRRAGLICAALAAFNPFLTYYAQETRMYSLLAVLSLAVSALFLHVFVYHRRRFLPVFSVAVALILYTHSWGIFVTVGTLLALAPLLYRAEDRKAMFKDAALAYGFAFVLYLPWMPTLIYQALHTGAPWLDPPRFGVVVQIAKGLLGGGTVTVALLLAAGSAIAAALATRDAEHKPERDAMIAALTIGVGTLAFAWLFSQFSPAWTTRYLGVALGPIFLLAAFGLSRAGYLGLVALVIVLGIWAIPQAPAG